MDKILLAGTLKTEKLTYSYCWLLDIQIVVFLLLPML